MPKSLNIDEISVDKFKEYISAKNMDSILVSEKEKRYFDRWIFIYRLLENLELDNDIVNMTSNMYNVHKNVARADLNTVKKIFAFNNKVDKEFEKYFGIQTIKKALKISFDKGDIKAVPALVKELREYAGIGKDESELPPPEDLMGQTYILQIGIGSEKLQLDLNKINSLTIEERYKMLDEQYNEITEDDVDNFVG